MTLNNNSNNNVQRQASSTSPPRDVTGDATRRSMLPTAVTHIPDELLKSFPHTKRVGNYLLGRTIGEGSFAKVKEGLHVITGEQVGRSIMQVISQRFTLTLIPATGDGEGVKIPPLRSLPKIA